MRVNFALRIQATGEQEQRVRVVSPMVGSSSRDWPSPSRDDPSTQPILQRQVRTGEFREILEGTRGLEGFRQSGVSSSQTL